MLAQWHLLVSLVSNHSCRLQALVHDILPPAIAITGYAIIGLRKSSANEQLSVVLRWQYADNRQPELYQALLL